MSSLKFYIVIPAHNEESTIGLTLESLTQQTQLPTKIVVVNDNSTDKTGEIISHYAKQFNWITQLNISSSQEHIPGTKVVNAFYKGLESLDDDYDIICKFDADLIFPKDYIERITQLFASNDTVGIAGGLVFIEKNNRWIYENIASKQHVRGPVKAYRKGCFKAIGGLRASIGWDTVDTLLAKYHKWSVVTDTSLSVKHLKSTGNTYTKRSKYLQGEALYKMRYGFWVMLITALKIAFKKRSFMIFINYIKGYYKAKSNRYDFLVSEKEGQFIRRLRWQGIWKAIGL